MNKIYRHGEIGFLKVKSIPKMEETKTNTIISGSHGHAHTFKGGEIYLLKEPKDFTIGYFIAKGTTLFHLEHGVNGKAKLPDGKYEIRRQVEFTPQGLIPVKD
jgi:hypothetical protein